MFVKYVVVKYVYNLNCFPSFCYGWYLPITKCFFISNDSNTCALKSTMSPYRTRGKIKDEKNREYQPFNFVSFLFLNDEITLLKKIEPTLILLEFKTRQRGEITRNSIVSIINSTNLLLQLFNSYNRHINVIQNFIIFIILL